MTRPLYSVNKVITFILNDKFIQTDRPAGMTLIDYIRYEMDLKGTKIGCREGDCGACTVLEGKLSADRVNYQTIVSCLTPLGNVHGKHIVTVEGINMENLSPVQEMLVEHNGTQCGFCTPGFVISLTAFLLSNNKTKIEDAIAAMDGNICRCTGYKSIERAAEELVVFKSQARKSDPKEWMVKKGYLPEYFNDIPKMLAKIESRLKPPKGGETIVGGGTDLIVRQPDEILNSELDFFLDDEQLKNIEAANGYCTIGAAATPSCLKKSEVLRKHFPRLNKHFKLISSTPIRNMGTLAGNIINASPIGDLSIFFLALNADVFLNNKSQKRKLPLKDFFIDYKKLNKVDGEIIEQIGFKLPGGTSHFNFEKVSKRQFLDIATVNSAISLIVDNGIIEEAHLSAGGVSPVPLYLKKTSLYLIGKTISIETIIEANAVAREEISPISDIRGSEDYKRLLLRQLIFSHFIEMFPDEILFPELLSKALK